MEEFRDYLMEGWKNYWITWWKDERIHELQNGGMEEFVDFLMEGWKISWITAKILMNG